MLEKFTSNENHNSTLTTPKQRVPPRLAYSTNKPAAAALLKVTASASPFKRKILSTSTSLLAPSKRKQNEDIEKISQLKNENQKLVDEIQVLKEKSQDYENRMQNVEQEVDKQRLLYEKCASVDQTDTKYQYEDEIFKLKNELKTSIREKEKDKTTAQMTREEEKPANDDNADFSTNVTHTTPIRKKINQKTSQSMINSKCTMDRLLTEQPNYSTNINNISFVAGDNKSSDDDKETHQFSRLSAVASRTRSRQK
ncbi:unnamed protein product [Didymodactylos carnosus]|nr:unnamed protein product [Didymodactylos carnosus]CAF3724460.1 unnamed protein product [Didymodactylos carnosus]